MYRTLVVLFSVFGLAFLLVALSFSGVRAERADYVIGNGTEPKTLDPQKMTGVPEGRVAEAIYEGLTYRPAETLKPTAGQAESWTISPDGLTWTFKIREAARWSNGDKVTAHDFAYAWKRLQEPKKVASEYAYLMRMVRHAEAYNTYGSKAEKARAAVEAYAPLAPAGRELAFADWKDFLEKSDLAGAIGTPEDPALRAALERTVGGFPAAETAALGAAIAREAKRVADAHAAALAHYGVDEGAFAADDRTFVVQLNSSTPYFLELTAFYPTFPVHKATVEAHPDDFFKPEYSVTNGPFRMSRWRINERIRIEKSPTYWGADKVRLQTVDFLPIENSTTLLNLYLTGEVDWAPAGYPPDLIDVVKQRPDYYSGPQTAVYYYRLNTTRPHLKDPRVRRAISLAFDRKEITGLVLKAGQIPATTMVPPGYLGYESPESRQGFDVETARRLLAEAGYPGGRGFPKLNLLFNTHEAHRKIAEYVAEQLSKNLGIEVNPANQEWQSYQEDTRRLKYDIARAAWVADYYDPNTFLDMWLTDGGNNQTGWGDPYYDRLIHLAANPLAFAALPDAETDAVVSRMKESDRGRALLRAVRETEEPTAKVAAGARLRFHLFREAEAILVQDAFPVVPIYFYVNTGLVSPRVKGFFSTLADEGGRRVPNLQDLHPFREATVDPPTGRHP